MSLPLDENTEDHPVKSNHASSLAGAGISARMSCASRCIGDHFNLPASTPTTQSSSSPMITLTRVP